MGRSFCDPGFHALFQNIERQRSFFQNHPVEGPDDEALAQDLLRPIGRKR